MTRTSCAIFLLAALVLPEAQSASFSADGLVTLGYHTKDLSKDLLSFVASSAYGAVSPHSAPVEKQFWIQFAEAQKVYNQHAKVHVDQATTQAANVYATVSTAATPVIFQVRDLLMGLKDRVQAQANAMVDVQVERFEKAYPGRKGAIPKDANSRFLLFVCLLIEAYVAVRLLKLALRIFCYFFCCGMCARRNSGPSKKAAAKTKTAPQAQQPKKKGK